MSDRLKIAYVAGPYRADTISGIRKNILSARNVAEDIWQFDGWGAICPHLNSAHMDGIVPDAKFLEADLEILRRCDAVVLAQRWETSSGTRTEILEARDRGIPVYLSAWDLQHDRPIPGSAAVFTLIEKRQAALGVEVVS
ncbi:DUF4406 domain-containing protein [bacterium]|nr:DUF4406 domain-containing protein [bacterium]